MYALCVVVLAQCTFFCIHARLVLVLHHDTLLHVHVPLASICMAVGGVAVPRTTG